MQTTRTSADDRAARLARLGITGRVVQNRIGDVPGAQTLAELRAEKVAAAAEERPEQD